MAGIDALAVAIRAASFVVTLQSVGAAVFLLLCGRHLKESAAAIRQLAHRSSCLGLVLVAVHYALEAGRMGGDLAAVADVELQAMVLRSPLALAAALRLMGMTLLAWGTRPAVFIKPVAALGAVATVMAYAFVGHTTIHPSAGWLGPLLVLHVAVAAFWFGSLLPLLMILKREPLSISGRVIDAFSAWAMALVPGLFLAGAVLTASLTHLDPQILRLPYGRILAFKIGTFVVLLGFAALNRVRLVPKLQLGHATAVRSFVVSVGCEMLLLVAVIAATAVLTSLYSPE